MASISGNSAKTSAGANHQNARHIPRSPNAPDPNNVPHPDNLAALTPPQSATLDNPIAWAQRTAGLTLDPWQRDVLLSTAPRLLLNATRQSGKSTVAALKAARTVLEGGLAV